MHADGINPKVSQTQSSGSALFYEAESKNSESGYV